MLLPESLVIAGDQHLGVASCAASFCHGSAEPLSARPVLQNEYVTWSHFDPHSRAWRVLLEPRSAVIARRLGLGPAHQAPACLACHLEPASATERGPRWQESDGIGCETCHGAAQRWIATHDDVPPVRHADNVAAGLRALERSAVRAPLCTDCHVGVRTRHLDGAVAHERWTRTFPA